MSSIHELLYDGKLSQKQNNMTLKIDSMLQQMEAAKSSSPANRQFQPFKPTSAKIDAAEEAQHIMDIATATVYSALFRRHIASFLE